MRQIEDFIFTEWSNRQYRPIWNVRYVEQYLQNWPALHTNQTRSEDKILPENYRWCCENHLSL